MEWTGGGLSCFVWYQEIMLLCCHNKRPCFFVWLLYMQIMSGVCSRHYNESTGPCPHPTPPALSPADDPIESPPCRLSSVAVPNISVHALSISIQFITRTRRHLLMVLQAQRRADNGCLTCSGGEFNLYILRVLILKINTGTLLDNNPARECVKRTLMLR